MYGVVGKAKNWVTYLVIALALSAVLFAPAVTHAADAKFFGPLVSPDCLCEAEQSAPDYGCVLETVQRAMNLAISLSIILFTIYLVIIGFQFITSAGNPSAREAAKKRVMNMVVGFCLFLAAWLVIDFVMKSLYDPTVTSNGGKTQWGPWNSILAGGNRCLAKTKSPGVLPPVLGTKPPPATGGVVPVAGNIQERICAAAQNYRDTSTRAGPAGGNLACAWAVNNVLRNAGVSTIDGDSVQSMEKVMKGGRGTFISNDAAVCGDIVMVTGNKNHVGICLNARCTSVISNSSSKRSFSWQSGPTFAPSYNDPNYKIYRVTN